MQPPRARRPRTAGASPRPWVKFAIAAVLAPIVVVAADVVEFTPHAQHQSFTVGVYSDENWSYSRHFDLPQAYVTASWTVLPAGDLASLYVVCIRGDSGTYSPADDALIGDSGSFTFRAGVGGYMIQIGDVNDERGASVELTLNYTADLADAGL